MLSFHQKGEKHRRTKCRRKEFSEVKKSVRAGGCLSLPYHTPNKKSE